MLYEYDISNECISDSCVLHSLYSKAIKIIQFIRNFLSKKVYVVGGTGQTKI